MFGMSVAMQKVYDIAKNISYNLLATDKRFSREVKIIHEDGSIIFFKDAFLLNLETEELGAWILCFTEHHGFHIYPIEDLIECIQFEPIEVEKVSYENL